MNKQRCLECGTTIAGRSDKRFCSDNCRAAYHRREHTDEIKLYKAIDSALKHNHKILRLLFDKGNRIVSKEHLLRYGFNFDIFTSSFKPLFKRRYYICYNYKYIPLIGRLFKIERKDI